MEVANEILKQVVPILMIPVNRYLRYLVSCTKYVKDMGMKMTELNAARVGVEEHMMQNTSSHLEVPAQVNGWLEDVETINAKVENVPVEVGSCLSLKIRHMVGRNALNIIGEIDSVMKRHSLITWTNNPIPLGRVDSKNASMSSPTRGNDFRSREVTFIEALKALGPNHKSHMIALCGMGGVGKTTMMQRLKKVAEQKRMFKYIIEVVIGEKTDPIAIQEVVANYLSIELKETFKLVRAERLRKWFKDNSDGGKTKFLIVLDDVWQSVDLNDIGLSPLPNQGVDFKVLLTSRDRQVCGDMGVQLDSIINIKLLTEAEAQNLFCQISETVDPELYKIGKYIVRKCQGLPIAIKTIACTLKNKRKEVWNDALSHLEYHDVDDVVNEVFKLSYDNLQSEETKSVFLLCGLYPDDFDIPTEELVRYGWALKIFKKVYTIREARNRLNTCIERLIDANLLIESDIGCVKMHDLVLSFVLGMFSKVEQASIVNHDSMLGWPENDINESSCKRISLTCKNMSEFPKDLKFPNLSILKLMHGDNSLRFPQDFYKEMEKLEVITYNKMEYPNMHPSSPQCSTNLRMLHLHECLLMFDCSSIGNLLNLEVLSFANSCIQWLPSTIGNLKKLRLLDLTNSGVIHIDNDVLLNLVKLEEIYMRVIDRDRRGINFTDDNCNEMAERSKNLSTLEFEFFENSAQPNNMSFGKLQQFKISLGRYFDGDYSKSGKSSENTLQLVTNKGELRESRINQLFEKTEVLCLSVGDMNDLEDVEVRSLHPTKSFSFYNLRVLCVSKCAELRYLFTRAVANTLSKLEHLEVDKCNNMQELIYTGGSGGDTIMFPKMKFLSLCGLPNLSGLCHNVNIIGLPQLVELKLQELPGFTSIYPKLESSCLLKNEVVIPNLEKLDIYSMDNLEEIWPCEFSTGEEVRLREIKVRNCNNLVNIFPCNPMSLLHHLEELIVENCGSVEVLFNIDLNFVSEIGEGSNLRIIEVENLWELKEVWRIKGANKSRLLICGFQTVEKICIKECRYLVNLFPCNPMSLLHHLEELIVVNCDSIEVLFNIDLDSVGEIEDGSSRSNLRSIFVYGLEKLREVWRIKGGNNSPIYGFQAVESIKIENCEMFRNVFTPITTNFDLGALMEITIDTAEINYVPEFIRLEKEEESSEEEEVHEEEISEATSESISNIVFPSYLIHSFHNLRQLNLMIYKGVEIVFEIESPESRGLVTTHSNQQLFPYLEDLEISYMRRMTHVWNCNWNKFVILHKQQLESPFPSLTTIKLYSCKSIKYLFSPLMAQFLSNVKTIQIEHCKGIEEVVSNRDDEHEENTTFTSTSTSSQTSTTLFHHLDSLYLYRLPNLKCIGGGHGSAGGENNEVSFNNTTTIVAFADQFKFSEASVVSWSLCQYVREITIEECDALSSVIPCYAAGQTQKLQVLSVTKCYGMKEVFESRNNNGCDEGNGGRPAIIPRLHSVTMLPNLKILKIFGCDRLEHISAFSALESLRQLQELSISFCVAMKVVVKEEEEEDDDDGDQARDVVIFPRLKSITLNILPKLMGFFLGKNEFRLPLLDYLMIDNCQQMRVFTPSSSTAPQLKYIHTKSGKYSVEECDLNFHIKTGDAHVQTPFPSLCPDTSKWMPWSFHNLIEFNARNRYVKKIIPSNELLHLQKLEKIHVSGCNLAEEVFEALEAAGTNDESQNTTLVKLSNLKQVNLEYLDHLRNIWKSNQWTVFEFPNLTTVTITSCHGLQHVFTSSMLGSLLQLQELHISHCYGLKEIIVKEANVVVNEEEFDEKINKITLPRLKVINLESLRNLEGFWLGEEDFSFPLLDTLIIKYCSPTTIFTKGNSSTPELREIATSLGSFFVEEEDINSFLTITRAEFEQDRPRWTKSK